MINDCFNKIKDANKLLLAVHDSLHGVDEISADFFEDVTEQLNDLDNAIGCIANTVDAME